MTRRTNIVGIFPKDAVVVHLVAMILAEQHDEWQVRRYDFTAESVASVMQRQQKAQEASVLNAAD